MAGLIDCDAVDEHEIGEVRAIAGAPRQGASRSAPALRGLLCCLALSATKADNPETAVIGGGCEVTVTYNLGFLWMAVAIVLAAALAIVLWRGQRAQRQWPTVSENTEEEIIEDWVPPRVEEYTEPPSIRLIGRFGRRSVVTQSQATYKYHWKKPEFRALGYRDHGAWSD